MKREAITPGYWPAFAGTAIAYVAAAKFGLALSVAYSNATPIWAPAGISLAAMLLFGFRIWPAVALGAFIANVTTPISVWTAGLIAAGNTLEAFVGAYLLRRIAGFRNSLDRVKDVLNLVLYGAVVSTAVSATIGTISLMAAGEIPSSRFGFAWQLWWHGDAVGDILVTPLILAWAHAWRDRNIEARRLPEETLLFGGLAFMSWIVFFGGNWRYPYVLFPFLVWGALRFRQRGAAGASFMVAAVAVWGILSGTVPVGGVTLTQSVQILQTLISILAITTLLLAASLTEREHGEKERAQSLSLLQATLDSTADGILVVDFEGRIVSFNERFVALLDLTPEAVTSQNAVEVLTSISEELIDPEAFMSATVDLYARHDAIGRYTIEFKDGRVFECYSQPQRVKGLPVGRVWSFRDVTQQRRLEDARRRFIADASHELRTPIAVVRGLIEVLSEGREALATTDFNVTIDALARQGERLRALVARMLDVGRIESRNLGQQIRSLELRLVVDSALEAIPPPDSHSVDVVIDEGIQVLADDLALEQVIANLLMNAYTHGGEHIELSADGTDETVSLSVSDDGPGVPTEFEASLFEPFSRPILSQDQTGSGLGLAIVASLVEAMGGRVRYERRTPKGARFVVELPRGQKEVRL